MASPPLCANGCGFYASIENQNLCSKCYNDLLKQQISMFAHNFFSSLQNSDAQDWLSSSYVNNNQDVLGASDDENKEEKRRCKSCNKKVVLLGFNCRCGHVFCGDHRYPEKHSCDFDYKTWERELLAAKNPVCRADKLDDRF